MDKNINTNTNYRSIPKVDVLLEDSEIQALIAEYDRNTVVEVIRDKTGELRSFIQNSTEEALIPEKVSALIPMIKAGVSQLYAYHMKPVVNGTGTILHTNLGRAPISIAHAEKIKEIVTSYSNLEYHLEKGVRGERYSHFEELVCRITGAEAAIAVNNNAAAVILILSTLTKGREVIVSRGELVEIGGKFRIPDVMEQSGSKLTEVGTTNKTHLEDYENAITEETSALLKVHTSNYKIVGFSESVPISDLAEMAEKYDLPLIEDLGSGVLIDLTKYGLSYEPTVQDSLKQGASIVCFSGDKLLGGPQAGIIVGKKEYIDQMKRNPLTRAIRIDKFTACALELVFQEYLNEKNAIKKIPTLEMINRPLEQLNRMAEQLVHTLQAAAEYAEISVEDCQSQLGGGSLPMERITSKAVVVVPFTMTAARLEKRLRKSARPIIVRVMGDKVHIDMRTLIKDDLAVVADEVTAVLKGEE